MHVHKACAGLCWSFKDVIRPGERYEGLKNSFRPNACRSGLRNLIGGGTLSRVSCRPTRYATLMPLFAGGIDRHFRRNISNLFPSVHPTRSEHGGGAALPQVARFPAL